jgi:sugar phosphate isomerase/epimerase
MTEEAGGRKSHFSERLAIHHWTLDHLPLADFLRVARDTGWRAVELRRSSFTRCYDAGMSNSEAIDLIRRSGIAVATLGTEYGLFFARGEERERLLKVLDETAANAAALGCDMVMTAEGRKPPGTLREAADNLRAGGDVCARHKVRFSFEFSAVAALVKNLAVARELNALVGHPSVGILLDAYHLHRSGGEGRAFADLPPREIFAFQYSDVPPTPLAPGAPPEDRLVPGRGVVRWKEVLSLLGEKGYGGYLSYECPNPANRTRPPQDVAREGLEATRALLG